MINIIIILEPAEVIDTTPKSDIFDFSVDRTEQGYIVSINAIKQGYEKRYFTYKDGIIISITSLIVIVLPRSQTIDVSIINKAPRYINNINNLDFKITN